jgi:hypothetical protein
VKRAESERPQVQGGESHKETEQDLLALAEPVADAVAIRRIALVESLAWLSSTFYFSPCAAEDTTVRIRKPVAELVSRPEGDEFAVRTRFALAALNKEDPAKDPHFQIRAEFILVYHLATLSQYSEQSLSAFAQTNGVFNAWPYWREFIQSTTARMGIPPVVVPVFGF